jgi:hypothetical protein
MAYTKSNKEKVEIMINVGDMVFSSRHGYANVIKIEIVPDICQGSKYGVDTDKVSLDLKDSCIFDLDNGHWSYGHDVHSLEKDEKGVDNILN